MIMCEEIKCPHLVTPMVGGCSVFTIEGQMTRIRWGYCPFPDDGPNRKTPKPKEKVRIGQQKHK